MEEEKVLEATKEPVSEEPPTPVVAEEGKPASPEPAVKAASPETTVTAVTVPSPEPPAAIEEAPVEPEVQGPVVAEPVKPEVVPEATVAAVEEAKVEEVPPPMETSTPLNVEAHVSLTAPDINVVPRYVSAHYLMCRCSIVVGI